MTTAEIERLVTKAVVGALSANHRRRRTCSLSEAVERHGHDRETIKAVVENPTNLIRHRWIPGRGPTGKELSIAIDDLDAYYGLD